LERVRGLDRAVRTHRHDGQATVGYGLIIAAGALAVVLAMLFLADNVGGLFSKTGSQTHVFRPPAAVCEVGYEGACIRPRLPISSASIWGRWASPLPVTVSGDDPHGLDPDHEGLGCEP
jgi:Flp pilus assembly pilin Flp